MTFNPLGFLKSNKSGIGLTDKQVDKSAGTSLESLQNIQNILKGDLKSGLSGGEKLMALGALLQSGSQRAQFSPQEVMQNLRQTALGRASTQMQLAQLQAAADRKAKMDAAWGAYTSTLTPEKQKLAEGYTDEQRSKALADAVNPEAFGMVERGGDQYMIFRGGTQVKIEGLPKDVERVGDPNHGYKFYYKGTTDPVIDPVTNQPKFIPGEISPLDAAQLQQGQQRINLSEREFQYRQTHPGSGSGGGSGKLPAPQYKTVNGKAGWYSWNGQQWVPAGSQNVAPPAAGSLLEQQLRGILGEGGGGRLLRN